MHNLLVLKFALTLVKDKILEEESFSSIAKDPYARYKFNVIIKNEVPKDLENRKMEKSLTEDMKRLWLEKDQLGEPSEHLTYADDIGLFYVDIKERKDRQNEPDKDWTDSGIEVNKSYKERVNRRKLRKIVATITSKGNQASRALEYNLQSKQLKPKTTCKKMMLVARTRMMSGQSASARERRGRLKETIKTIEKALKLYDLTWNAIDVKAADHQ
ncbi:hypothetical protein CHS0354_008231 [Potamilus streckersoni]|uniref:Uncharacterized protein n=1 Tax=Potamilus streckersoni TaxID=2493646 RepID=A0AAE0VLC2_9BIVA|nr:hypothetical protein CHS0354_008231 [Potamilus streckersoni]